LAALGAGADKFHAAVRIGTEGLLMTPRRTGTDGFFVGCVRREG
jgi:16S rRNA (cytosine967-C5)-methyltransferase